LLYENLIVGALRNKFLQLILPGFSGAYFLCLDVWGDKWKIISDYQHQHEVAFSILITASLIVLIIRGIADYYEEKNANGRVKFMEGFILLTSRLVKAKVDRFKEVTMSLKPASNIFKQITQPKDQINLILNEVVSLIYNEFGIKEGELCLTIMHQDPKTTKWYFEYETNRSLRHTKPEVLMKHSSTASKCLEIGEPIFHPDKKIASDKGEYFLSDRDKRADNGSVFCYPAFTKNNDYEDKYIISIVTYGKTLCSALDSEQANAIKAIFSDICRRIDLELTLESIKKWQFEYHTNSSRRRQ
jgi:hypothetical protein